MKSSPRVLLSVLSYNSPVETVETIRYLEKQDYPNVDVIVVDNASRSDCVDYIQTHIPGIRIVRLYENLGYTGGNNVALAMGLADGYDYVIVSNDDIAINEHTMLSRLIETGEYHPDAGIIGIVEEDYHTGNIRAVCGYGFNRLTGRGRWLRGIPDGNAEVMEAGYVQGAFLLFSRAAIQLGLRFDENLFMYGEEMDLYFQLKALGLKAFVDTRCRVRHKALDKRYDLLQGYYIQRNRLYLIRKYAPAPHYLAAILYCVAIELPVKVVVRCLQGQARYASACLWGFADGLLKKTGIGKGLKLRKKQAS